MMGRGQSDSRFRSDQLSSCFAVGALQLQKIQPVPFLGGVIAAECAPVRKFCPLGHRNNHL
ncbi:hypothetical protein F2Q69_00020006 [Brassica cretica]|uniref:Uncharacterized protein n=1 Tax=Brassica cretica TaxID=69181 RepID=A0A8S9PU70_BRACR|nr:hypothetical protein F2Q69_00020006 [Brassica cretica]